jgi:hypothetical protein
MFVDKLPAVTHEHRGTPNATPMPAVPSETLREVVQDLAGLNRTPCSHGEREAAIWIARRLRVAGCDDVTMEEEPSWGPFLPLATGLGALSAWAAGLVLRAAGLPGPWPRSWPWGASSTR